MARVPKSIQILTANRLNDGRVVFWTQDRTWDIAVGAARVLADPDEAESELKLAMVTVAAREVVDPYPIGVSTQDGAVEPLLLREKIRAYGPTVPCDFSDA